MQWTLDDAHTFYKQHRGTCILRLYIYCWRRLCSLNACALFYPGKFFFDRLANSMIRYSDYLHVLWLSTIFFPSSGPLNALVLAGEGAISRWRQLIGPTKIAV